MNDKNNYDNKFNLGNWMFAGAAIFGAYKLGQYIESRYFKDKTEEEINVTIDNAFKKINAYAELAKDGYEILGNLAYNLRYGYTQLSVDNATVEKIRKLWDIAENIRTVTENNSQIAEPIDIIEESLKLMLPQVGERYE